MKNVKFAFIVAAIVIHGLSITSCKRKDTKTDDTTMVPAAADTTTPAPVQPAPIVISADDSLTTMAKDAVKDFPGVTATVMNGELTLTGNIKRDKLKPLMNNLHATHPKKINNNLTINP